MSAEQKHTPARFTITWRDGAYYVSIPNYGGGEVVRADIADDMLAALKGIERCASIDDAWLAPVRAAIAKATGAQS